MAIPRILFAAFALLMGTAVGCSGTNRRPAVLDADGRGSATEAQAADAAEESTSSIEAEDPEPEDTGELTIDEILAVPGDSDIETAALDLDAMSIEALNAGGHLADVYFDYDSANLSVAARETLDANAAWLLRYESVRVLIEGHCDERGTVEYNLALGESRARAIQDYLIRFGVGSGRLSIVSYGKEFPLDPGHDEVAWRRNRRGHFQITAK